MRPIQLDGTAPLEPDDLHKMLTEHIPYRLSLVRDGLRPAWVPPCQHTNQAFEAGAVSGRILLSLLGLKCSRKAVQLQPDQKHDSADKRTTDDVKAPDVGAEFVDLESLSQDDRSALAVFIRGVNKACAHFTVGSDHELNLQTYAEAGPIIFRLMAERFPNHATSWPKWTN